jgi:hypothetical protein
VDFAEEIQPILAKYCYSCHGPEKQKGDLRWDRKAAHSTPANMGRSLCQAKRKKAGSWWSFRQGPGNDHAAKAKRLSDEQIESIRAWINEGADWRKRLRSRPPTLPRIGPFAPGASGSSCREAAIVVRNPIDSFILARMEHEGLAPSPEADSAKLARRLKLDLQGLPPTPKEIEAFQEDHESDAYDRMVERFMTSPHFGERWAQHWLDVARYADSNGYEKDRARSIWPYRDWVIRAFNTDLPYDQFAIRATGG